MRQPRPFSLSDRPLHRDNPATRRAIVSMRQAGPREAEPQMPLVRLLNLFLLAVILWMAVIGWGLSEAHKAGLFQ